MKGTRHWLALLAVPLLLVALQVHAETHKHKVENPAAKALRVCADPSNMPFSNKQRQGFENKIAALFGKKLGVPVEYYWKPEQFGFARITLKKWLPNKHRYACDLIISTGSGLDVGKTTLPYYRSTYVLTYLKGHGLDTVHTPSDLANLPESKLKHLKIGVFAGSPVANWMLDNNLDQYMVSYKAMSGSYDVDPADMVSKDLVNGKIDVAMVWGPIGGYYAKHDPKANIVAVPFTRNDGPRFDFPVSMGVRYGNDAWLNKIQQLINNNHAAIMKILKDYGVPIAPLLPQDRIKQENDDD